MDKEIKQFLLKVIYSIIIIGTLGIIAFLTFLKESYTNSYLIIWLVVLIVICSSYIFLVRIIKKNPQKFPNKFSQLTLIKILVFLVFLTPFILAQKDDAIQLTLVFFILYLTYTTIEVISLQKFIKKK